MSKFDLLMNDDLVERFLEGETTSQEEIDLAYAMAEYYPWPQDAPTEELPLGLGDRISYIVDSLGGFTAVDMWMYKAPGLPRLMANISRLSEGLYDFPPDIWILRDLDQMSVPTELDFQWLKNDDRGGADELAGEVTALLRDRDFPQAGWMADRILGILLEAAASGEDFPEDRAKLTAWCTDIRTTLRQDATTLGLDLTGEGPECP